MIQKSIELRNPYTDVLNLLQVELLRRYRAEEDEDRRQGFREALYPIDQRHRRRDAEHGVGARSSARRGGVEGGVWEAGRRERAIGRGGAPSFGTVRATALERGA